MSKGPSHLGIRHITLRVASLDEALVFFTEKLGYDVVSVNGEEEATVRAAGTMVRLSTSLAEPVRLGITVETPEAVEKLFWAMRQRDTKDLGQPQERADSTRAFEFPDGEGMKMEALFAPRVGARDGLPEALILVAEGGADTKKSLEGFRTVVRANAPQVPCEIAFADGSSPRLDEAFTLLNVSLTEPPMTLAVAPLWFLPSLKTGLALAKQVTALAAKHKETRIFQLPPLMESVSFRQGVLDGLLELLRTHSEA